MRRVYGFCLTAVLSFAITVLSGCGPVTEDEIRMLNLLNQKYANKYSFSYQPYCYVRVRALHGKHDYDLISNEYRAYLAQCLDNKKIGYRYFNLYDTKGEHLYQMCIAQDGTLTTSTTEHH